MILQDARYALRALRRRPLFTAVAVGCLTLGIAVSTTMFSVFDALVVRPLPFRHPERLVSLFQRDALTGERAGLSFDAYQALSRDPRGFAQIGAYAGRRVAITQGDRPELVRGQLVSAGLFPMLGVGARTGRLLNPDDDRPGAAPVVLLGDAVWRRQFGADPSAIGRAVSIDHRPYTVVGVMPPGFEFPEQSELWLPIGAALTSPGDAAGGVSVVGRLRGVYDATQAAAMITPVLRAARRRAGVDAGDSLWAGAARPLASGFLGSDDRIVATAMFGATLCLLLIACANVANLLLTRAIGRQREFAVRMAIGASRGRLAAQLLVEGILLSALASALAVPLVWQALGWIRAAIPPSDPYPYYVHWSLDGATFTYAALATLLTGTLFGAGPVLRFSGGRLTGAIKEGTPGSGMGGPSSRLQKLLVVGEVTLAVILLVGASLFARTFIGLRRTDLGYDPARLMTMRFFLPGARYDSGAARIRFVDELLPRLAAVPGVSAATVSDLVPLDDEGGSERPVVISGRAREAATGAPVAYAGVAGDWVRTFGVHLIAGRSFTPEETLGAVPVAIVDRAMANRFWPHSDPVGQRFRFAEDSTTAWFTIVGVAPDLRTMKLDENRPSPPEVYLPLPFARTRDLAIMVRTALPPMAVAAGMRAAVHAGDPTVPVFKVWTMGEVRYLSFWMYGLWGTLFSIFGGIALLLAAVGVYAVMYYRVAQRTRDIGVRVALGASRRDIARHVLGQGVGLAVTGVGLGLVGALVLSRVVGSLLIGVSPTDPASFGVVVLLLVGVAALASYVPARRATAVDPLVALREE